MCTPMTFHERVHDGQRMDTTYLSETRVARHWPTRGILSFFLEKGLKSEVLPAQVSNI